MRRIALLVGIVLLATSCGGAAEPPPTPTPDLPTPSLSPRPPCSPSPSPVPTTPVSPSPTAPPTSPAPGGIPDSLIGTQWYRLPTSRKVVALTFDAGANADGAPAILAALEDAGVPATFFLTGRWAEVYPGFAADIGGRYPIGNHTYSHPDLVELSDVAVREEIRRAESVLRSATGRDPRPWFRFPYGSCDPHAIEVVNDLGYGAVAWTVDTRGWQGTSGGQSADSVLSRVLDALGPGAIVIMHVGSHPEDGSTLDADALPRVIEEIRARGYGFVTLEEFR